MNADQAVDTARRAVDVILAIVRQGIDGIVLHGSLASGSYVPDRSDIDLLVVLEAPVSASCKRSILSAVAELLAPSPTALDLRFTTRETAARPPRFPTIALEIAAHPPHNTLEIVADETVDPDLLIEFAVCRDNGRALYGNAPHQMIAPVPHSWLLDVADDELVDWQRIDRHGDSATMVTLTACRIWRYANERVFCSKAEAARWALDRAPACSVIAEALRSHQGQHAKALDESTLPQLLAHARDAVAQAVARVSAAGLGT